MPKLGLTMEEGTILRWLRSTGETVKSGDAILEVEGDKTTAEVDSPADGVLLEILAEEGDTVEVGGAVGTIGATGEQVELPKVSEQEPHQDPRHADSYGAGSGSTAAGPSRTEAPLHAERNEAVDSSRVLISPRARRLAEQHGIDWTSLTGSDAESGRIQERDVRASLATNAAVTPGSTRIPFTSLRATIARRLQQSVNEAPHIHLWADVDATEIRTLRERYAERFSGERASFGSIFLMAAARSLIEHPRLNATVEKKATVQYETVNLCMAIGLGEGVVAPVIRDAGSLTLSEIQAENDRLVSAARAGVLQHDELNGGTFSVTSLGSGAVRAFTAVLNPPQVGILSVGAIEERPAVYQGQLAIRPMVTLGLSVDHRAVDGIHAAAFLQTVKERLENPAWMIDEGES